MAKYHGGTDHIQGVLRGKGGPKPRIYANHGGTNLQMGEVHGPSSPRQYGLHGGTNLKMGVLKKSEHRSAPLSRASRRRGPRRLVLIDGPAAAAFQTEGMKNDYQF
jgi:hypothetical protein